MVNSTAAILKNSNCDISAADHPIPIYSVFGSRTGFSGSADRIALFPVSANSIVGSKLKHFCFSGVKICMQILLMLHFFSVTVTTKL